MNENATNYQEWIEKIHKAAGIMEKAVVKEEVALERNLKSLKNWKNLMLLFVAFILAMIPRLYFIFLVSAPENAGVNWYGDTYHHWQIGYLTLTTGLHQGFLRLWDLKGLEFFWGVFHPLLLVVVFTLTGSNSIIILRILSAIFGSMTVLLLYSLGKRYFGTKVGVAIAFFAIVFPIVIFNDATGSLEEFGIFFILLGLYLWPKHALWTGIAWTLAAMVRAEAWLFSFGLLTAMLFLPQKQYGGKKVSAWIGWGIPMLLYMKYLMDYTGNPIYPVYWNFLANGVGVWANVQRILTPLQEMMKPILEILGVISGGILLWTVVRRPKSMLLLLYGFGTIFFVTAFMGFGHYLTGWEWWFPIIRFFVLPYLFLALILFVLLSKIKIGNNWLRTGLFGILVLLVCIVSQLTWYPIMLRFNETVPAWRTSIVWGQTVGKYYTGGSVLIPEGDPNFTYTMVVYGKITGEHIRGQMYDPFFYIGENTAFANYPKYRKQILSWLKKNDIRLAVFRTDTIRYNKLIAKEPELFEKIIAIPGNETYVIWTVHSELIPSSYAN